MPEVCVEKDIAFPGSGAIKTLPDVASWKICYEKCKETAECKSFTWIKTSNECWLKKDVSRREKSNGKTSVSMGCVAKNQKQLDKLTDFNQDTLPSAESKT